jgi:hypothetical protein
VRNDEGGTMNDEVKHSSESMLLFIVHRSAFIHFLEIDRTGDGFQTFFFMDLDLTR